MDLSFFCEVELTPSKGRSSVVIGACARWTDISRILDREGLVVVGGRNSAGGIGGLTIGGKQQCGCFNMVFKSDSSLLNPSDSISAVLSTLN